MTLERKFGSLSIRFFKSWHKAKRVFFCSCVSRRGTNFAATCLMFKSTVKIHWQELQLTPIPSEILSIVYRQSSLIFVEFFRHSHCCDLLKGAQNEDDLQRSFLFWTTQTTRKLVYGSVLLPYRPFEAFHVLLWLFFRDGNKISSRFAVRYGQTSWFCKKSLTTLGRIDNTWENWQHKPVQFSTATSTWLLTHEGCNYTHLAGDHSTTIRKRSRKPVRYFLGPPTYMADRDFMACRSKPLQRGWSYWQLRCCQYSFRNPLRPASSFTVLNMPSTWWDIWEHKVPYRRKPQWTSQ